MALELNLRGKNVLITGGSKGLGLAAAKGFAAEGCNLYLSSRNAEMLEANAAELRMPTASMSASSRSTCHCRNRATS